MVLSRHPSFPSHVDNCEHPPSSSLPGCTAVRRPVGRKPGFPRSLGITATRGEHGTRQALGFTQHIPSPAPSPLLRRDTKAILSVLISSALHVFGEWGQLCGRLAEFQEVDVFLGFNSSLFALDEVATRESPFMSPLGWHWLQQGKTPWDTARGLSPC